MTTATISRSGRGAELQLGEPVGEGRDSAVPPMRLHKSLNIALRNARHKSCEDRFQQLEIARVQARLAPRPLLRAGVVARAVEIAVDAAAAVTILVDSGRVAHRADLVFLRDVHPIRVVRRPGYDLIEAPEPFFRLAPLSGDGEFAQHVEEL